MKIQAVIAEAELKVAILNHVVKAGYPVSGMDIEVNLIKGKGPNGNRAVVDFIPVGDTNTTVDESIETEDAVESNEEEATVVVESGTDTAESSSEDEETEEEVLEEEVNPKASLFG